MRCEWYFQNDMTESFSQLPAFQNKSSWDPPKGNPALKMFLNKLEGCFRVILHPTRAITLYLLLQETINMIIMQVKFVYNPIYTVHLIYVLRCLLC